jgi:tetratricopeptide (TPR) repeat protein
MPKRQVRDVVHTAYTDHRIQRPGTQSEPAAGSGLTAWRDAPPEFAERNYALALFESAVSTRDGMRMQQAFRRLSQVQAPGDFHVLSAMGSMSMHRGAPGEAVRWLREAVEVEPGSAEAHFRLGRAEQALGRPEAAIRAYERAIRLDPLLFDIYAVAAQLHRARGDWESYRRVLHLYLKEVPQSIAARQALAAAPR